jgi:redox-sensitive bicupin YhaK (pirin superfamily)
MKAIRNVLRNQPPHWVGDGFPVRTLFSYQQANDFDPFLLLDYGGPYDFAPAEAPRGVGEHPHRGFETVTIVYQGELEHRDSAGNHGTIGAGEVQWMTAAAGVVHEEFHSEAFTRAGGAFEVVQLWINLPARQKLSPPRYQEILSSRIASVDLPNGAGKARIIAGDFQGTKGPAKTFTPIQLWDLRLKGGARTTLHVPEGDTTMLVIQRGSVTLNAAQAAQAVELVQFDRAGSEIALETEDDVMALLLSGAPLGEPVYGQGPFVMTTREEILQAIADFQSGKMGRLT